MTEEQLEHIFDPFYTTKEPGEGTGLGLSTIYNIVRGHNGHIQCSSQPGKGTEFTIDLPALQLGTGAAAGSEEPPSAASLCHGRETILLVEDENAIREFLHELLQSCGYHVLQASNGQEALTLEGEYEGGIDLILLDLGMPGMSGEQFLKERPRVDGRKIILISGYDSNRINKVLTEFHIDGAVRKPFHLESFLATIRNVLDAS
jgi:CheY-like chemotaxis protein